MRTHGKWQRHAGPFIENASADETCRNPQNKYGNVVRVDLRVVMRNENTRYTAFLHDITVRRDECLLYTVYEQTTIGHSSRILDHGGLYNGDK